MDIWQKNTPSKGNNDNKGSKAGACPSGLRNSKEASVPGAEEEEE